MMVGGSSTQHHPFGFSQVPGEPSFRSAALNAVALIPLLSSAGGAASCANDTSSSSNSNSAQPESTHSLKSFGILWEALGRHSTACSPSSRSSNNNKNKNNSATSVDTTSEQHPTTNELLLVVANSSLTRPGDWRYQETPLKAFHWQYGCQRLHLFDGRPDQSRLAQDRLLNPSVTRDWIDLCPHRRTAAVIGVLNIRDCKTQQDFDRAQEELHHWATQRYATPPYQVTAHGKLGVERDQPVERLFVFDSFDEDCQHIDMTAASILGGVFAFPPSDASQSQIMDLHLNVVVNDLAVAIFQSLEAKIRQSDELAKTDVVSTNAQGHRRVLSRYISGGSGDQALPEEEPVLGPIKLSLQSMASLVSPENKLAQDSISSFTDASPGQPSAPHTDPSPATTVRASTAANLRRMSANQVTPPQLLTPLDDYYEWSTSQLSAKDTDILKRRDMARREKIAADLSLLAGSPLDAYERYLKAAHMSKLQPDPLWYAMAMVGCAASHIAMAEGGGYNVDEYLENNFSLPEDILAVAYTGGTEMPSSGKKTFPEVVFALCEEALAILNRHPRLAPFHAGLLLQLALYSAESAETHLRCRWGEGFGSYAGETRPYRWEKATQVKVSLLKTRDGRDMIDINVMNRTKIICELLQQAVSVPDLDPATRLDIAIQAASLFLEGIPGTTWKKTNQNRIQLPRKAAFFTVVAAEAMSTLNTSETSYPTLENMWLLACQLYSRRPNDIFGSSNELGSYAWATLRASTLHALSLQGSGPACLEASEMLLNLLEEIRPKAKQPVKKGSVAQRKTRPVAMDTAARQASEMSEQLSHASGDHEPGAETYTASVTKMIREGFTQATGASSLLNVQAKWASDPPKKAVNVPLAEQSLNILALPCVWNSIGYDACATAQRECAERITTLKKGLCRSSAGEERALSPDIPAEYVAMPLSVSPTWSLLSHQKFEIELVPRKLANAEADKGAMATFYNPFEKKGGAKVIPVAAEEERVVTLHMKNWLTVPLSVKECRLSFSGAVHGHINSAPVSFVLPPLVVDYPVQFPFTILSLENSEQPLETTRELEVEGVAFTCLNHSYTLSLAASDQVHKEDYAGDVPKPAAYPRELKKKKSESNDEIVIRSKIEALPCQPRLSVRYAGTTNSLNPGSKVVIGVTNGELISTPMFELANAPGPKGRGLLERVQVSVLGIPGTSSEKFIFDSENSGMDDSKLSDSEFLADLLGDNPAVLKVRILPGITLDLNALNSPTAENANGRTLGFQIALAENFREKINNPEPEVIFRIRYAGKFTETKEVWRRFDFSMTLSHFTGPRVASMAFRADLADNQIVPGLLQRLNDRRGTKTQPVFVSNETDVSCRVGLDHSVHVHSESFVVIVTILNDSNNDIVLSRPDGSPVSSFASTSLPTLMIPRGVKVSLPMSVPRLSRSAASDNELVRAMTMSWKTVEETDRAQGSAHGNISTNSKKISELIAKAPSVIPSIFQPPCSIQLEVQGSVVSQGFSSTVFAGELIDMGMDVSIASWVSPEIRDRSDFTIEFFAVWLGTSISTPSSRDHVWCGMVRRNFSMQGMQAKHAAKVILLQRGKYALSACVRLTQENKGDEVWWAPVVATITVDPPKE